MIKLKDGYAKLIGTTATGSANNVLLSNGGDKIIGNASGNIPLNNGTLNVDLNADKLDGYDSSDFFRHEGLWSSTDDTKNVDSANGMLFVYKKHGVPEHYGTIATFKGKNQPNYYNLQLYGSALNKLFFRNWSPDLGQKDWVEVLSTGNYTKYLGYVGTTAVQAASAVQDLTGISNIEIASYNNEDRYITFNTGGTRCWRLGYIGSGTGDANYLTFQSTKAATATDGWSNALTLGCETLQATFSGNILVDKSVPIIQAKGTNGAVSLQVDSQRGLYDHVTKKWALGITAANNTYLNVGNVGIGTASPSEKLHVAGKVLATHFVKSGATNAQILLGNGSNTGAGVKGNFLYYTAGVPGWTTTRYFSITLDDNAGKPVYLLISDVTAQQNATSSAPVGEYGIVGTFYGYRGGNMSGTSVIDIVAYAAYSKNNVRLRSSINPITGSIIPYIVKYQEKYYIALKKKGSGRTHYFHGLAFNLLDSFITVSCTDAQGTCPDIEIIHEPEGWTTITSTQISDYTNTYNILHSGNFKNVIGNGSYWKVNDKTYNVTSNGSTSSEDIYLEMWRGTSSSWRMINTGGHLKFRNNYTTEVGNYFDVLSLAYASGDATLKGKLHVKGDATSEGKIHIKGEGLYLDSSGDYPRFRVVSSGNAIYIQAGKGDGSAQEGSLYITGQNTVPLTKLDLKATTVNIPGRVIIKNAKAHDALDVFTTYNAYTYLRLGRDYGNNNCSEFLYEYAGLNSTNNNLRIGFYNNSTSLLRGYAGGNWVLNNNLSINKEFNANDKHFNYALAYNEIPGFNVGGMVVITLPNTWNTAMNLYEIDIYDYVGGTKVDDAQHSKLTIGVYNYTDTNYYNYGYTQLGSFNRKIRLAHDGTHCCILLGEPTSTWNYTQIFLSRVLAGHSEYRTWSSGYEINLVTSEAAYTKITELHRTRQRFDDVVADNFRGTLVGNADTASSAAKWTTARTLTVGNSAKTVDGSANVTWDLESILKNPTTIGTTSSWDITVPGVYGVTSVNKFSGTNNPEHHTVSGEVYRYGQLIVSKSGHGLAQFYISHRDSDVSKYGIKYRTGYGNTYVSEWARLLDTLNYEKYVVKLDGHSLLWNNLYYTYKEVTMDTPDTVWYVKIVLSGYAQPNLMMINTGYNNRVDRAFLQFTGQFMGYFYRNNCQNQGNLTGLCLKTGYDSVEKKWIFWLRFKPISSTAAEGPATSATCKVYLGQSNNAFDISATTTAPEGVTWETVGTAYTSLLLRYATIRGNLIGNSDSATKAYLTYNNTSTAEYPIIWSNSNNTTSQNGSLFKSYSDLTYSPSNKRLTVKGQVTSPQFFHNQTSASSNPVIYIGSNNQDTTLLRVYSSDAADTSTFTGRYGYSLKYLGSDGNNRLVFFADNNGNTAQQVALAFTNAGNVGIRDYAKGDYSLYVNGDSKIAGNLLVGNNATRNYIAFYGTTSDNPGSFINTYIGENIWGSPESSELVLFKGNDVGNSATTVNSSGADRIRHIAAAHLFQIYKSACNGTFEAVCTSTTPVNIFAIESAKVQSYVPIHTSSDQYSTDLTKYGIHLHNSDVIGANGIYFADAAGAAGEGIHFYRDGAEWDTLHASSGVLYFSPKRATASHVATPVFSALTNEGSGKDFKLSLTIGGTKRTVSVENANMVGGYSAGRLALGAHKTYGIEDVNNPNGLTEGWYTLCTINDTYNTPVILNIRTYAHSSMIVAVNKGFNTLGCINILGYMSSSNANYYNIKAVRLLSSGAFQIKLVKTGTSSNAAINVNAITCGEVLTFATSLTTDETTYPNSTNVSIVDEREGYNKGSALNRLNVSNDLVTNTLQSTNLFINTGDATLKVYDGKITDGYSDGNICFQTCFDHQDGQSHSYATTYPKRCNLVLQPRAGQVYIGINPKEGNTNYKLYVNGAIYGTRFAGPADKLTTARTIALGEAVQSTATAFDGSANISIPVTGLKESYLVWGDKNKVNDLGVIDNCFSDFSSNKLSFMNPDYISVEYSNDGGSTWTDYGATAEQKTAHVTSTLSHSFYLGNNKAQTTQDRLRITITARENLYFAVRKLMVYFCMNGATGNTVLVETSKCGSDTTFTALGTYSVSGWTGWNSIPVSFSFGGADTQTGNTRRIRFTYQFTGHSSGYESKTAAYVQKTYIFGAAQWSSPHSLSSTGHLYSFDVNQRAVFPKLVEAVSGFKKTGSSDSYVLLGGGGHKAISSFQTTYDSRYVLKSGDTMTGKLEISGASYPLLTLTRSGSTKGALIQFKNNNGTLGYIGMKQDVNSGLYRYTDDTVGIYKVWDEGNDGPGSGLNADLLDGTHKSDLLSSITSTHVTNLSVVVGGTTKDVTKLWSSMLVVKDIRGTNVNPSDSSIQPNAITAWFNNTGTPTANWYSGFSVKGWGNNYGVWQLCSYSSDGTPTGSLYFRQGEDDTWKNWRAILDDSNTSVSGGGSSWGDSITININGTSTTLTIPNQPEDVNVTQTNTTTSANYRVLLSKNANDTTETASSRKSAKLYFNPSTGVLTTTKVSANLDGDIVKKTPQLCAATESDNINIVENSNGAITNNYISNMSAIRKAIQFKWYNTYWQIGNIRGGASGTDGFGVTYGSDKLCFRVTEAASYVYGNMYAVHFYESSDKRLKTNIQEILNSDKMPTIKEFDWKEDGSHSYGLIAQELEEQGYSELVSIKDNGYKTVNYSAALSLIVGKLQVKIRELEKEIENLKNKN